MAVSIDGILPGTMGSTPDYLDTVGSHFEGNSDECFH